jgi:hypothetical protein
MNPVLCEALAANGAHPSLGAHAETYGRVIGSWEGDLHYHHGPGSPAIGTVEVHFGWVLEGRAVQDVWITPARKDRAREKGAPLQWYGTTVRVFDPKSESWRAIWIDPTSGLRVELEGRRVGDDIVQIGTRGGRPIRWTFSRIQPESFLWQGHALEPDGITWQLEVEMRLRRG